MPATFRSKVTGESHDPSINGSASAPWPRRSASSRDLSAGVVEDDADRVPLARSDAADSMPQVDPVVTPRTSDRPMMHGENHGVTLTKRHDLRARLHAWPLLGEDGSAAGTIADAGGA